MSLGGVGCISTVSNIIPRRFTKMIHDYLDGNYIGAGSEQVILKPLIDSLFEEVNPGPVKAAMNMLGMCNLEYRLPLCAPTNKTQFLIYDALEEYGLI
jgi:4-hydroxy-tetrahydrodipicolinate synthase